MDRLNLEEWGTIDPLSRAEERELIRRYQEDGDMDAREQVVKANLRFVISVAKQFTAYLPLEDAIGEGSLGLLKALDRFDASRGYKFITHGVWWIRQAIHEALRNEGHILRKPQVLAQVNERFRQASRELEAEKSRYCLETEVFDAMAARDHEQETFMTFRKPVASTDEPVGRGRNGVYGLSRETIGSLYVADTSPQRQGGSRSPSGRAGAATGFALGGAGAARTPCARAPLRARRRAAADAASNR